LWVRLKLIKLCAKPLSIIAPSESARSYHGYSKKITPL